jgi:ABC-type lipoprotein export system ATPase subunit
MNDIPLPHQLSLDGIGMHYGDRSIFRGVNLSLECGQIGLLLGASGSGKTSLLHILGGLLRPMEGHVRWGELPAWGHDSLRGRIFGFIFQQHSLLSSMTVGENVILPWRVQGTGKISTGWRRVEEVLALVDLADRHGAMPYELSGGERQRASIARALILRPPFLLADEPTGSLDGESAERVRTLLTGLARKFGTGLLVASHDNRFTANVDRIFQLEDGILREKGIGE